MKKYISAGLVRDLLEHLLSVVPENKKNMADTFNLCLQIDSSKPITLHALRNRSSALFTCGRVKRKDFAVTGPLRLCLFVHQHQRKAN